LWSGVYCDKYSPETNAEMNNLNIRRIFLYTLIASVAVSSLIGIGVVLLGDFGEFEVRVLMITLTVTMTSILGLANRAYLETGR